MSLKKRLLITSLSITVIVWSGIALFSYYDSRQAIKALFDSRLAQTAAVLMSLVNHEVYEKFSSTNRTLQGKTAGAEIESHLGEHKHSELLAFQILVGDHFFFHSALAPPLPLSDNREGFNDTHVANKYWRVFTIQDDAGLITIHVAEPHSMRSILAANLALDLILPLLIGLPIVAFLIWQSIGRSLRPLNRVADEVRQQKPKQLEPLSVSKAPSEVIPLVNAINHLMQRLNSALENERRFTADAAHELRTPLAGLKTQAQVALRSQDIERRETALKQLSYGIDGITHLIEQLLTLARLDPENTDLQIEPVSLRNIVNKTLEQLGSRISSRNITCLVSADGTEYVNGNTELLMIMLRNLLDNAITHTPEGGRIFIKILQQNDKIELNIMDTGPGIPAEQRELMLQRFVRGSTDTSGSGLGLSIAQRIAEFHNTSLELSNGETGGLNVRIVFRSTIYQ